MDNDAASIAHNVEKVMSESPTPSKSGYDALQAEYRNCMTRSPSNCNKTLDETVKIMTADDKLSGILRAWEIEKFQNKDPVTASDVEKVAGVDLPFFGDVKKITPKPNEEQLDQFLGRELLQTKLGFFEQQSSKYELQNNLEYEDTREIRAVGLELLNTEGPSGRLWKKLESVNQEHDRITIEDINKANDNPAELKMSPAQIEAVAQLQQHWTNFDTLKKTVYEDQFHSFNPLGGQFAYLNPAEQIKPWNHVVKEIGKKDYIAQDTVGSSNDRLQLLD